MEFSGYFFMIIINNAIFFSSETSNDPFHLKFNYKWENYAKGYQFETI